MAQKIKILMLPRGMQKKMIAETGYSRTSIWYALTGKSFSEQAMKIRDIAISQYDAFVRPSNY